ncbi:amidase domain-containing protein [Cohnella suwonensis]|uniref:Amidase domain-containing protein n=1 Tax=Cohnella suwonensis TaxID=696072 RepID=A0ABW0LY87_9BACL
MPSDNVEWKQALFDYVSLINEAALQTDARKLRDIPDKAHRERLTGRINLSSHRDSKIAIKPVRSEMRARIERFKTGRTDAVADVSIHLVRTLEQRKQPWVEERIEREKIRFVRHGGLWRLDTVKPIGAETPADAIVYEEDDVRDAWDGDRKEPNPPPAPYMNPQALYGFKSKVYSGTSIARDNGIFGPRGGIYNDEAYSGKPNGLSGYGSGNANGNGYGYGQGISRRGIPYFREEAVAYAERWWNEPNPSYEKFEVNCTNYASQCIFAGGAPMNYTGKRPSGWWYKGYSGNDENWSFSWAVANSLKHYLGNPRAYGLRAAQVSGPEALSLGDVICYDWDGSGRVGHNVVVTAFTPDGMPLVNANTVSSRHRYWDYKDSYAWTDNTRYYFYHIADEF